MALRYPEPPLADGVVGLRPWTEADLPLLREAAGDDYVAMIEHLPVPYDDAAAREWIGRQHAHLAEGRGWSFAIVHEPDDCAVGGTGITLRHPPGAAEPGCWVLGSRRNRGFAERATRLLCYWALTGGTGIERVEATVEPWNAPSQRVLEKVGFVREGVLRSYTSYRGTRQDVVLYSLLESDLESG